MSDGGLRQLFRKHLAHGFDWQAIETGTTSSGVPDMNYATEGVEGWIEMKACAHWRCTIRPMQIGWIERRLRHNPRVFVAVRRAKDELWFFHGSFARRLLTERLDAIEDPQHCWIGGPANWDWQSISRFLKTG